MKTDKSIMYESLLLDINTVAVSAKTSQETIDEGVVACNVIPARLFDFYVQYRAEC